MTYSPSPWRRAGEHSGHIWAPDGDGVVQVAIVGAYSSLDMLPFNKERWDADANLISAAPEMLEALEAIVNAEALSGVEALVAGWNGPPEKPYSPHPANLGASIKTTCGRVYKLDEALKSARAAIAKARGKS